jgi:hypothetical protein
MKKERIPGTMDKFITYIILVNTYLHAVAEGDTDPRGIVLGMTTAELSALKDRVKKFMSGDPSAPGFWDLHSDEDTKNKLTRANMVQGMKQFKTFFRPLLNRISGSAVINNEDRGKLNIAAPPVTHKKKATQIVAKCFTNLSLLGACLLRFENRASADSKRASKAEFSDAVEIWYRIVPDIITPAEDSSQPPVKSKPKQMIGPSEATVHAIFTRAIFTIQFPDVESGNNLQFYVRWTNTKHPEVSGPWSAMIGQVIS